MSGVRSVKKGKVYYKGKVVSIERDSNGYIREVEIWDGYKSYRYVLVRDANEKISIIEYYERFEP